MRQLDRLSPNYWLAYHPTIGDTALVDGAQEIAKPINCRPGKHDRGCIEPFSFAILA